MERPNIEFRKRRDFGQKFNATFEFIRQEFKPLITAIIYIAGPIIAITAIISSYFQRWSLSLMDFTFENPEEFFSDDLWSSVLGLTIFSALTYIFLFAVLNEYVKNYIQTGNHSIETPALWSSVRSNLGDYALSIIVYVIIMFGFLVAISVTLGLIISSESVLLTVLAVIGFLILLFMTLCVLYLAPIVYNSEKTKENVFSSIGRTVELLRGKWLSTLALLIISSLIASVASFIFAIPNYILTGVGVVHSLKEADTVSLSFTQNLAYGITSFIASAGQYLLTIIPIIAVIFQYYNLVERRDASGLMDRIDQMGAGKAEDADESF